MADDQAQVAGMLAAFIDQWLGRGVAEVVMATNGNRCLTLVRDRCPSLALIDVDLPRHEGLRAAQNLRQLLPTALIVGMATSAVSAERAVVLSAFDEVLEKPFSLSQLTPYIDAVVERGDQGCAAI